MAQMVPYDMPQQPYYGGGEDQGYYDQTTAQYPAQPYYGGGERAESITSSQGYGMQQYPQEAQRSVSWAPSGQPVPVYPGSPISPTSPGGGPKKDSMIVYAAFLVANIVAIGLVIMASTFVWQAAFGGGLIYLASDLILAWIFEQRDKNLTRSRGILNLIWMVAALLVFLNGLYFSINVFGGEQTFTSMLQPFQEFRMSDHLASLLPPGSTPELKDWAASPLDADSEKTPSFAVYFQKTFFAATGEGPDPTMPVLWYSDGHTTKQIIPRLTDPKSLLVLDSKVFFSAISPDGSRDLWAIDEDGANHGQAYKFYEIGVTGNVGGLFMDPADTTTLYFKADHSCGGWTSPTVFRSDGTTGGTHDLKEKACNNPTAHEIAEFAEPASVAQQLLAILGLAAIPQLALAIYVARTRCLGSMYFNIFGGIFAIVMIMYMLVADLNTMVPFLKVFFTLYCAAAMAGVIRLRLGIKDQEYVGKPWPNELFMWSLYITSLSLFGTIHLDLLIFSDYTPWYCWALYAPVCIGWFVLSVVLSSKLPLVLCVICTLNLSWEIAGAIKGYVFEAATGSLDILYQLAVLFAMFVVAAGIWGRSGKTKADLDDQVQECLLRFTGTDGGVSDAEGFSERE